MHGFAIKLFFQSETPVLPPRNGLVSPAVFISTSFTAAFAVVVTAANEYLIFCKTESIGVKLRKFGLSKLC